MIELGKSQPLTATCARGLEKVLADELRDLGVDAVAPDRGAVMFAGDLRTVYDVNLRLRTAMRVLAPLVSGVVTTRDDLYDLAASVAWDEIIADGRTFAVEVVGKHRSFNRTTFAGQVVKDAIVDRLREIRGRRPNVDRENPDVRLHLRLVDTGQLTLSLDSTGEPCHTADTAHVADLRRLPNPWPRASCCWRATTDPSQCSIPCAVPAPLRSKRR